MTKIGYIQGDGGILLGFYLHPNGTAMPSLASLANTLNCHQNGSHPCAKVSDDGTFLVVSFDVTDAALVALSEAANLDLGQLSDYASRVRLSASAINN